MMQLQGNHFSTLKLFFTMKKLPIGIDVSMKTLDYYEVHQAAPPITGILDNTIASINDFLANKNPDAVYLVIEPTGTYSDKLFELAIKNGFEVRLAAPLKSSQYTALLGIVNKTDQNAAYVLATMGEKLILPKLQLPSKIMKERRQVQMTLNSISKQCRMLRNQLHAMEQRLYVSQTAKSALQNSLDAMEQQQELLKKELQELTDEDIEEFSMLSQSVIGIGPKTSNLLMIHTNGMKNFNQKSQLPKFVGTIGQTHRSGSSINIKKSITKSGPSELRACLYNAAKSAKRYNNACKALYERLRKKGKPHKVAMIAVINKLLHQVFAVIKSKTKFDNDLYLKINY